MSADAAQAAIPADLLNPPEVTARLRRDDEDGTRLAMQVKRLSDKAKMPTRGSEGSAGWDLYWYLHSFSPLSDQPHALSTSLALHHR